MNSQFENDAQLINGPSVSPLKTALKYGLYMGLGIIIFSLIMYTMSVPLDSKLYYIQYGVYIAAIWFGIKYHRDIDLGGYMSYGRGLGCGTLIALVGGIIGAVYSFILFKYIDPDLVNQIFAVQEKSMLESGQSQEQVDQAINMSKKFMTPAMMGTIGVVVSLFSGFIVSLVLAFILKKEKAMFGVQ
ncbi:DUF4199 domain-containing protein [Solitalea sp. MAHUQ-68]|uniref:DUF4199 domain-containing protein n=1 Tax=Solitalea agri TaxID=2953739 RepID=A0A9X2F8C3_9SPHI|nr:DUF4199 domain-containing protein [Solitalea agri]MCO4294196.1 DUF4199 domain-containing protein [Solitalea agri]